MRLATLVGLSLLSSTALAVPGANHRVGDAGFVAAHDRAPTGRDSETERMHAHLTYIRAQLAAAPATDPTLAARRTTLLGYLDDYIAKGTTPTNAHLPFRSPVFIDDAGAICAVGYLIERDLGSRALPARIAAAHRYDYLETIAGAMPEVADWVRASGFTLEELASIQPGYIEPEVESWRVWPVATEYDSDGEEIPPKSPFVDGAFEAANHGVTTTGRFGDGKMQGAWKVVADGGTLVGSGTLDRGAGTWTSKYATGELMATGPIANNRPHGAWRFFHASGNLAAEGAFLAGDRHGAWSFYHDTKERTPIATGTFHHQTVAGTWRHFDARGALVATSTSSTPAAWKYSFGGHLLSVTPGKDGVRHEIHQGNIAGDHHRLDGLYLGDERLYLRHTYDATRTYDANGFALERVDGTWRAGSCHWSEKRKRIAANTDITTLHGLLGGTQRCDAPTIAVSSARAARLDRMVASLSTVRSQSPAFVRALALGETTIDAAVADGTATATTEDDAGAADDTTTDDLAELLAANMTWYVEWPHVDGRFLQVFRTIAGYRYRLDS